MDDKRFLRDPEMRAVDVASRIAPKMSSWPVDSDFVHWTRLRNTVEEARSRLTVYRETVDEIEKDPRLSPEGKAQERRKAALKALGAFNASKSLSRARQSVSDLMDKWQAKVAAAVRPASNEAEAALHAEVRRHVVGLKGQERMSFLEQHGSDPRVAASVLEAPAFLTGLTDAERSLVRSKIEQAVLDSEIVQAKKDVTRALADSEHGWERAQALIGEDAGLRKSADGTWSASVEANADAAA